MSQPALLRHQLRHQNLLRRTRRSTAGCLAVALLSVISGGSPGAPPTPAPPPSPAGAGRQATYAIRSFHLEQPQPAEPGHRAKLILLDEHPSPVAWLFFWDERTFDPEKHWNREADLERCPKCHPQYELHFPIKDLPAMMEKLRRLGGKAKLTFRSDRWDIEEKECQ